MSTPAPAGAWPSAITADAVVAASVRLGSVQTTELADGMGIVWWAEGRPAEGGRTQIVRRDRDGRLRDVLPEGRSANSRIHEYGGGAWLAVDSTVYFVDDGDQRIWRLDTEVPGAEPVAVTLEPPSPRAWRYAIGGVVGDWLICVQEVHGNEDAAEPANHLVAIPTAGGRPVVLFDRSDFVGTPAVDPAGGRVAFVTWDHPNMPWDSTRLWVLHAEFGPSEVTVEGVEVVAGGEGESICQPRWAPDGRLWFVSDRTGWWNLFALEANDGTASPQSIDPGEYEVGEPAWVFGQSRYAFLSDGRLVAARRSHGLDELVVIHPERGETQPLDVGCTEIATVAATATTVVFVGASYTSEPAVRAALVGRTAATTVELLRPPRDLGIEVESLSIGEQITFPTGPPGDGGGRDAVAHATFYPATNPDFVPLDGEVPPLLVMIHGGPTSAARAELRLGVQYWTSRGIAVVDVDYRGSTGYGRPYRDALRGEWGVSDVEDCVAAARYLADTGRVDGDRLLIRGGSAGGFTTLAALAFTDVFAAGASYYGVADLALLAVETHKFESRYLDGLVGPYPQEAARYEERSPLAHIERLDRPVIVFQGLDDRVVPPSQAEAIIAALAARHVPHASMMLAGEGHGFRKAENIRATLEAEWSFYLQIFGIPVPVGVAEVELRR